MNSGFEWWKEGIYYHIYVRSFFDSNNDGIGDLPGITKKLDYIESLGAGAIWLSPIHKSPMADSGYDVSDYWQIDEDYGTIEDFENLIRKAHAKNIRVIMDIAINHTSIEHPWFIESRQSKDSPKRDWYIWKKGKGKLPPNNWMNGAFESAWTHDSATGEFYLHSFLKEQPDLNWRNPEVQKNFLAILEYWFGFGVDGFRLDMVNWLIKDKKSRNNPALFNIRILQNQVYNKNQSEISIILKKLRRLAERFEERVLIGEVFSLPPGNPALSAAYIGGDLLNLAFDFSLVYRFWSARSFYKCIETWDAKAMQNGWPVYVLSNHDQLRSFTRLCKGRLALYKARLLAVLLLTLRGAPFIYYGEELGLKSMRLKKNQMKDPLGIKFHPLYNGRDRSRLPMQWSAGPNAGFSSAAPWLPVPKEYTLNNAEKQETDSDSLLWHYRRLAKLRNENKALSRGHWQPLSKGKNGILSYYRKYGAEVFYIILNFSGKEKQIHIAQAQSWFLTYTNYKIRPVIINGFLKIRPCEAVILSNRKISIIS